MAGYELSVSGVMISTRNYIQIILKSDHDHNAFHKQLIILTNNQPLFMLIYICVQ